MGGDIDGVTSFGTDNAGSLYIVDFGDGPLTGEVFRLIPTTTAPNSFTVFRGLQIAGELADVHQSDDSYLKFNPGITLSSTEPPVWILFDGIVGTGNPEKFSLRLEARANTVGLEQTIQAFNWSTSAFETVDASTATLQDSVFEVDVTGNLSSYVQPGTGAARMRTGWISVGPLSLFPWTICIDQIAWSIE